MKILKILDGNDGGGVNTCETQFINRWREKNHYVHGLILGDQRATDGYKEILNDYTIWPKLNVRYGGSLFNTLKSIFKSKVYAKNNLHHISIEKKYDAIIYRRAYFIHVAGELGNKFNIPIFWHLPDSANRTLGRLYYNYYIKKYSITAVANSRYTKNSLGSNCEHIIYPGFDSDRISSNGDFNIREKLGISEDALVFGTASRITSVKAQDLLIKGLIDSGILNNGNVHCIIAGGPTDTTFARKCIDLAKEYSDKFHFLGEIDEMTEFYKSIDVYVNSRRDAEPFGISIAEAMGSGLPVIAYHLGGPEEMIVDGENGWLISESTVSSYAKVFKKAYNRRNSWKKMGEYSKVKSEKFNSDYNADQFLSIINKHR